MKGALHKHAFSNAGIILGWSVALLLVLPCPFKDSVKTVVSQESYPHSAAAPHTLPTILSVVDPDSGYYISALENPLYQILKESYFINHGHSTSKIKTGNLQILQNGLFVDRPDLFLESVPQPDSAAILPSITLDRDYIHIRDPLRIQWYLGRDWEGNPFIKDDDDDDGVLVVSCDDEVLEAATLRQAKATSQKHLHLVHPTQRLPSVGNGDESNVWYFPDQAAGV